MRRLFAFEQERVVVRRAATRRSQDQSTVPAPPAQVSAGRFGLIGLSDVQEAMGSRWPALEQRVRALAETVITRHLVHGDVFEAREDGSYVVLFAQLDQEKADFKCRVIGKEITERLLGSEFPRLADVESVSAQIPQGALQMGDLEVTLAEAFEEGAATISSDPASPRPTEREPGGSDVCEPAWAPQVLERSEREREPGGPAPRGHPWGPQVLERPDSGPVTLRPLTVPETRQPAWRDLEAPQRNGAATVVPIARKRARKAELLWRYTPVWDFDKMSLLRFRLAAGDGATGLDNASPTTASAEDAASFEIDVAAVAKALDDLSRLTAEGRRLLVICVIRQNSLGVQWRRDQILELIAHAPPHIRRLLRIEVFSSDFDPTLSLVRFVEALEPLGVLTAAGVPLHSRNPVRPAGTPLKTASVEVGKHTPGAHAIALLNTFSRRSAQVGLQSAAHGLDSRALVVGAIAAGVRFLSGDAVHVPLESPGQGMRFEPSDLYRDLLVGGPA